MIELRKSLHFYSLITGGTIGILAFLQGAEQQIGQQCQTYFLMAFNQW